MSALSVGPRRATRGAPRRRHVRRRFEAGLALLGLLATSCAIASPAAARQLSRSRGLLTVSMFGDQDQRVVNLTTNQDTKLFGRKFGLRFKFDVVPPGDVQTKQPILLSSGQYPDVIFAGTISQEEALQYGSEGVFLPLNRMLKKYAPHVWKAIKTTPGMKQEVTAPNGKIYALPGYNICIYCSFPSKYYINIADLNRFGLTIPKTTEQFQHVLTVFKQHGLVPLSAASNLQGGWGNELVPFLMNAFIPYNATGPITTEGTGLFDVNDHKQLIFVPKQSQWRAGLEYIHSLYKLGLFPESALTQTWATLESVVSSGNLGVVAEPTPEESLANYGAPSSHYTDWMALPALKGPAGVRSSDFGGTGVGGLVFAVTNHTPKAVEERVLKLVNYLWTPVGAQTENFGPPGEFWVKAKKGQEGLGQKPPIFDTYENKFYAGTAPQNNGWDEWGPFDGGTVWRNQTATAPAYTPGGELAMDQLGSDLAMAGHQSKYMYPPTWIPSDQVETYTEDQTNINNYVAQWTDEFITGQKSLTNDWSAYLAGLNKLGLSQYMKLSKAAMRNPIDVRTPDFLRSNQDIKYLISMGPVPSLAKKYMIEAGVPADDFTSK